MDAGIIIFSRADSTTERIAMFLSFSNIAYRPESVATPATDNIELTSCFTEATINEAWNLSYTSSIFPISKEQLEELTTGVTKARIELLCLNTEKNTTEYSYKDYEYSKDEIGKNLKKWSEAIEKESISPTITPEDNSPKDIHENF